MVLPSPLRIPRGCSRISLCHGLADMASKSEFPALLSPQGMPRYGMSHPGFSLFNAPPSLSKELCNQFSILEDMAPSSDPVDMVSKSALQALPFPL